MELAPIRPGEELNVAGLAGYLGRHLPGTAHLTVEQFPGGHSNLTYLVRTDRCEYVLRRPPLGPVPPRAHDMAREYRVLAKVQPAFPAAPKVYLLCEDISIIGAPFFLMERRQGIVLRGRGPAGVTLPADFASRVSQGFMDCFVALHAIDLKAHDLLTLGRPEGFLQRQVQGWADRWRRAGTHDQPDIDRAIQWLADHVPQPQPPALVHNDFKLDNLMLNPDDIGRIEAVLDWEMTTIGDPLADVGLSLCYWTSGIAGGPSRDIPGWFSRDRFIHEYSSRTGRDVSRLAWYEILGSFKLAVILQQIYFRWKAGQTSDERFAELGSEVQTLAHQVLDQIQSVSRF